MEILNGFLDAIYGIYAGSGLMSLNWQNYIMIAVSIFLLYLAIKKQYEPLLLLPIAFGMLLVNLYPDIMSPPAVTMVQMSGANDPAAVGHATQQINGVWYYESPKYGGLLYYLYQGVKLGIYPPLIFLGIGCMTDFFSEPQSGAIAIIGGADGPTAIFVTTKLAPELLGSIAIAAYSYMALVPIIQPPIMKALTTKKERSVVMEQLRPVSKLEKIIFPIIVVILISIFLPDAAPLVGMLMLGNLFKESGVVDRIAKAAQNELMNIITIFLGVTVGATAKGSTFLTFDTIKIIVLGLIAFSMGTAFGVLFGKLMYKLTGGKVNPLIGSAGVSAVPMAARVSQRVGQQENPGNFLLMHAMGPNVAGVIGSAVAAGVLLNVIPH